MILVAAPSAGSVSSLEQLVDGKSFAFFLPDAPAAMLGTMPSIYQVLPRPRLGRVVDEGGAALDLYDPAVWQSREWGLADPRAAKVLAWLLPDVPDAGDRSRIALDQLTKCLTRARQFHQALDAPADRPRDVELTLFAGDAIATPNVLTASPGRVVESGTSPGDGTVTRASALADERLDGNWTRTLRGPIRWDNVTFIFDDHLGLTRSPAFSDNVLYRLLEQP